MTYGIALGYDHLNHNTRPHIYQAVTLQNCEVFTNKSAVIFDMVTIKFDILKGLVSISTGYWL